MGSVRQQPKTGRWEARYRDPAGRQRTKTFARKGDAKAYVALVETEIRQGVFRDPLNDKVTFGDWHDRWWRTIEGSDRSPNTILQYESLLRLHVLPHLGDRRLVDLRRMDFEEWLAKLRTDSGLGLSTVRTCRTLAGMVVRSAMAEGIIRTDPLAGVELKKRGASRAKQALTAAQLETLAVAAEPVGYRVLVLVLGYGGLRPNEAFALKRRHLDDFGNLVIAEGLVEVRGRLHETDGKTHQTRVVPLPASVLAELREHLTKRPAAPDAFMFTTRNGQPIGMRNFRRTLGRVAQEAELPSWFTPYSLRHTCASLMAQRGVPVTAAASIMGHDPAMYLRVYAHLYPGDLRSASAALDDIRSEVSIPTATVGEGTG